MPLGAAHELVPERPLGPELGDREGRTEGVPAGVLPDDDEVPDSGERVLLGPGQERRALRLERAKQKLEPREVRKRPEEREVDGGEAGEGEAGDVWAVREDVKEPGTHVGHAFGLVG